MTSQAQRDLTVDRRPAASYVPELAGIRAIGILLVVVHHGLQPLEFGGYVGVDVFFVLSGYLITRLLINERRTRGRIRLRTFYLRRAIRLYPPLLLAVAIVLPFGLMVRGVKHLQEVILTLTYLTPITEEVWGRGGVIWKHTWSLGIEEIFYLVWPVALILIIQGSKNWRSFWPFALGMAMSVAQVVIVQSTGEASVFLRAGGLFVGCALALWLDDRPGFIADKWVAPLALLLLAASVVLGSWIPGVAFFLAVLSTTVLIVGVVTCRTFVSRLLTMRAITYLGDISYDLYLWHFAVLAVLAAVLHSDFLHVSLYAIPMSLVLASLSHQVLQRPISKLKNRFPY